MIGPDGRAASSKRSWSWLFSWWLPTALAAVPTLLTVWAVSPPGGYLDITLLALGGWLVAGTLWLVVAVLARRRRVGSFWPLLAFPVLLVGMFLLVSSGVITRVMFEAHRPGLESLVADVAAVPDQRLIEQRVGLFAVSSASADRTTGCTMINLRNTGFLTSRGFAYCPGRPPIDDTRGGEGTTYEHVGDAWYTFSFAW